MPKLSVEIVNGNPVERILVIAPDEPVFRRWCHRYDINPYSPNIHRIRRSYELEGYFDSWCVNLGYPPGHEGQDLHFYVERTKRSGLLKNAEVQEDKQ